MMLANGIVHAGPYAVALGIVDPGVGTARKAIAVATAAGPRLVGPDNGLLSLAWKALGGATGAVELDPVALGATTVSAVFQGRDLFAPAAAQLVSGAPLDRLGPALAVDGLVTLVLEDAEASPGRIHGAVLDVDRFGNIQLNARPADLERAGFGVGSMVEVATTATSVRARRVRTYSEVPAGEYGLLVDAWDWVSVIRYEASAAAGMGVTRGDPVWIASAQ
jgi:hypothetical protein